MSIRAEARAPTDRQSADQAKLVSQLQVLKDLLRRHAETRQPAMALDNGASRPPGSRNVLEQLPETARQGQETLEENENSDLPSALDQLCAAFSLSSFERSLLLLCAGIELDSAFAPLCAAAHGEPNRTYPTFSLALAVLPDSHWSALIPSGPLRRWRLVEVSPGPTLTTAALRIDERVLHHLTGVWHLDERLAGMVELIAPPAEMDLAPSQAIVAANIAAAWTTQRGRQRSPVVQLCSPEPAECRAVAAAAAHAVGLRAAVLTVDSIPAAVGELDAVLRLWEREASFGGSVIVAECDMGSAAGTDDTRMRNAVRFVERVAGPVIISAREPHRIQHRAAISFHVSRPLTAEQRNLWRMLLKPADLSETAPVDAIASQFSMSYASIRSSAAEALAQAAVSSEVPTATIAWHVCRSRSRVRLDDLAQRIEPVASWNDLVLPEPQIQTLHELGVQVRQRAKVYDSWGFAAKSSGGLGISALFAGASGTGKTMAAEVLAGELQLDLYRIDLASVVNKYIGETEKNLRRVFDAAEESGAILLFDEADALFGKRSEVKDSHDRYANIEVSYLLQRMEAYRGLAILTSNLKGALDTAFLRRLRFVIQFPFPAPAQRGEIWQSIFPQSTPTRNLDYGKLARLNVSGGNIRNIAVNAAFLAAEAGEPVGMTHLLRAARAEYAKLERPMTEAETGDWT